jgi:N6-L-threonylcarbamoyladenine synthase
MNAPNQPEILVLGVESSCDDTAAAVVRANANAAKILSNVVWNQNTLHEAFGGIVPEIAARAHAERLDFAIEAALDQADCDLTEIGLVAATAGPGLIGGVASGLATAQTLAIALEKPFAAINHLEGHVLSPRLSDQIAFPYLLLLVSGGHGQLIEARGLGDYRRLGGAIDDSPGEALDKFAKHLGLRFPGGPEIEKRAETGNPDRFDLPRPLLNQPGADMSFSGLKTAARLVSDKLAKKQGGVSDQDIADLCAGYQAAIFDVLIEKTRRAMTMMRTPIERLAVAGGVAANKRLRKSLTTLATTVGATFIAPPFAVCTDNGAMIAWAGAERFFAGLTDDPVSACARPRWPLDENAAPLSGGGRKGPKL